jgi:hypothetical protein
MADDIDEVEAPDELIEDDLEELAEDDDLIADDALALDDDDDPVAVIEVEVAVGEDVPAGTAKAAPKAAGEEPEEEEEEEPDDEDVEASLDTILKERLVVEEVEDDEETPEPEDRRIRLSILLPGEARQPACGQEEDALPRLRLKGADHG